MSNIIVKIYKKYKDIFFYILNLLELSEIITLNKVINIQNSYRIFRYHTKHPFSYYYKFNNLYKNNHIIFEYHNDLNIFMFNKYILYFKKI